MSNVSRDLMKDKTGSKKGRGGWSGSVERIAGIHEGMCQSLLCVCDRGRGDGKTQKHFSLAVVWSARRKDRWGNGAGALHRS